MMGSVRSVMFGEKIEWKDKKKEKKYKKEKKKHEEEEMRERETKLYFKTEAEN